MARRPHFPKSHPRPTNSTQLKRAEKPRPEVAARAHDRPEVNSGLVPTLDVEGTLETRASVMIDSDLGEFPFDGVAFHPALRNDAHNGCLGAGDRAGLQDIHQGGERVLRASKAVECDEVTDRRVWVIQENIPGKRADTGNTSDDARHVQDSAGLIWERGDPFSERGLTQRRSLDPAHSIEHRNGHLNGSGRVDNH